MARIAIVGGSLGGLTAACLLRDDGHDVTIFERSPNELEERGAGIGFLPANPGFVDGTLSDNLFMGLRQGKQKRGQVNYT